MQGMQAVFTDVAKALNAVAAAEDESTTQLPSPHLQQQTSLMFALMLSRARS